jgi:hypothetical protein
MLVVVLMMDLDQTIQFLMIRNIWKEDIHQNNYKKCGKIAIQNHQKLAVKL